MKEICEWFACVYAMKDGCTIKGYIDAEGKFDGTKEHCPHYEAMCISAKCSRCGHINSSVCKNRKEV